MAKKIDIESETHKKLVAYVQAMVRLSDAKLSDRIKAWENAEKTNVSYVRTEDYERKQKVGEKSTGYREIYVPYTYSMQMSAHTYLASTLLGRDPVFQYDGINGQGQDQILMAESVVGYQLYAGEMLSTQYLWMNDILQYGVGIQCLYWDKEERNLTVYEKQQVYNDGIPVEGQFEEVESVQNYVGYEGQKGFNVRPKDLVIDPRVGFADYQRGEFIGRRLFISGSELKRGAAYGKYFNVEKAIEKGNQRKDNDLAGDNPARTETSDEQLMMRGTNSKMVNLVELFVRLIPSEWGLGSNRSEEVWVITVAERDIVVGAAPSGWEHGMFPYILQQMEFDAYGLSSRGFPEIGLSLEQTYNWLINSHMYNVDKAVFNEFIYDPTYINTKDFLDPKPGKRIRLKAAGFGKDIRSMIHQFTQVDVTRTHLQDLKVIESAFQKIFGISDSMMGSMAPSGRRTATEVRSSAGAGLSRMKVMTEFISAGGFSQLGRMLLLNSRQMYSPEQIMKISGKAFSDAQMQNLSPDAFTMDGDFLMKAVDGSLPMDKFAMVMMYKELLMGLMANPTFAGRYDVASIFAWIVKLAGVKNLDSFKITAQDEERIAREVQRGNMITTQQAGVGDDFRNAARGAGSGEGPVAGTTQVSGMGSTG